MTPTHKAVTHGRGEVETFGLAATDALPAEVHGFRVSFHVGPHPEPTQKFPMCFAARLVPADHTVWSLMRRAGKTEIVARSPLTRTAADLIEFEPNSQLSENVARITLAEAARLARRVKQST